MKLQEVLTYLDIESLPKAGIPKTSKCACLVERVTGEKDYAIAKNGGIVADLNFRSSVKQIIEFYPIVKKQKEGHAELASAPPVPEPPLEPIPPIEGHLDPPQPQPEPDAPIVPLVPEVPPVPEPPTPDDDRESLIAFLIARRNKREVLDAKSTDELRAIASKFGKA